MPARTSSEGLRQRVIRQRAPRLLADLPHHEADALVHPPDLLRLRLPARRRLPDHTDRHHLRPGHGPKHRKRPFPADLIVDRSTRGPRSAGRLSRTTARQARLQPAGLPIVPRSGTVFLFPRAAGKHQRWVPPAAVNRHRAGCSDRRHDNAITDQLALASAKPNASRQPRLTANPPGPHPDRSFSPLVAPRYVWRGGETNAASRSPVP